MKTSYDELEKDWEKLSKQNHGMNERILELQQANQGMVR